MTTSRTFFTAGLLLMVAVCAFFWVGLRGEGPQVVELAERHHVYLLGTRQFSMFLLPALLAACVGLASLGFTEPWIGLSLIVKRLSAWIFASGMALAVISQWMFATNIADESDDRWAARWLGFAASLMILLPVAAHLIGLVTGSRRQAQGGTHMRAARIYALGGMLVIVWGLAGAFWRGWPWLDLAAGLSAVAAGLFTWPIAITLGGAALFLSTLQLQVAAPEKLKLAAAAFYFAGCGLFVYGLHSDLLREGAWSAPFGAGTRIGLALLMTALGVNLLGLMRGSQPAARPATSNDPVGGLQ